MKRIILIVIGVLLIGGIGGGITYGILKDSQTFGYTSYWYPSGGLLKPITSSWGIGVQRASISDDITASGSFVGDSTASISGAIHFGNLISCDTIDTDATGLLKCGSDATGGGSGMVLHGLLGDEYHSDVLNASVSEGDLIIGNATPKWSELTIGASQSFLMSDGTTAFWADYQDQNTTYTAGDNLTLTLTDFDLDPFISITAASISEDLDLADLNATSASFSTITLPADAITEANINFSTACAAGNHYYLSGTNLACETDANTTYTATDPLFLTGTAFDIDYASAGGGGYILGTTWEDFNGKLSSLSIDTSAEIIAIVGDETGSNHLVFDTSPEFTTSFTTTGVFGINPGGALTIGDNGDTTVMNSSDWDISATGDLTNIGAITMDGILTVASSTVGFGGNVDFYSTASTSSNFDFNSAGLIINIGNAGTDFTSGGGLNIAGVFALATDQLWTTSNTGNVLTSHSWQFSTGQSVEFDGTASTSGNWTANNGVWNLAAATSFSLGTSQLWNTSKTSEMFSSASWGFTTGNLSMDGTASTSGNWTINKGVWDFGGATSFEFPNGTSITLDANGEAGIDTTSGQFQYYSDEINVLMASTSQGFGIKISSTAFDLTTGGDTFVGEPGTIIGYGCSVTGGTNRGVEIIICDGTTCGDGGSVGASITAVATGITFQDAVTSGTFGAWDEIKASTSDADSSGTVQWIKCRIFIKPTAQ